jgi:hypothetical protein
VLKGAKAPALVIGTGALSGPHGAAVAHAAAQVAKAFGMSWNVLHTAASRVGGLDMGFLPAEGGLDARAMTAKGALDVLFLLGADEIDLSASDAFRIYLGSHGDAGAHAADLIFPASAYTEKDGLYVNLEGRVQMGQRAVFPKGEAREDWTILRALSERLGKTLPYDSLDQLRARLFADHPTFGQIDYAPRGQADLSAIGAAGDVGDAPLASAVEGLPSHQSGRARQRDHGRVRRPGGGPGETGGGVGHGRGAILLGHAGRLDPDHLPADPAVLGWLLISLAFFMYGDRKIWAGVQMRKGPNVVGPFGLLQSFADLLKFILKEIVIPDGRGQDGLPPGSDPDLRPRPGGLGGHSRSPRAGWSRTSMSASSTSSRSPPWASTASSWAGGPRTRSIPSWAACARRRRWSPTRSPSAS